jgi:hypothetical protein
LILRLSRRLLRKTGFHFAAPRFIGASLTPAVKNYAGYYPVAPDA